LTADHLGVKLHTCTEALPSALLKNVGTCQNFCSEKIKKKHACKAHRKSARKL